MRFNRTARSVAALALLAVLATACGDEVDLATAPHPSDRFDIVPPPAIAGLAVKESPKATKQLRKQAASKDSYARQITVYEMRQGTELRAALEVMRLAPDARVDDPEFRREMARLMGAGSQRPVNRGGVPVYQTKQNEQHIFIWFEGLFLQVLTVRASATQAGQAIGVNVDRLLTEILALQPVQVA